MKQCMINGFGRIGRTFLRILLQDPQALEKLNIAAINIGPGDAQTSALLFKHDTLMRTFAGTVSFNDNTLTINNQSIRIFTEKDPARLPHKELGIDWVIEASGHFATHEKASLHRAAGAGKVLITAPADDADITIIPGINMHEYNPEMHHIVSLGSCTTNAFAPLVDVLQKNVGIVSGLMTTTHAYTNDQVLLDVDHKDPRRARAAALNMVPTKTGADKVIIKIFPELQGKLKAVAIRVPVPLVSLIDFACITTTPITAKEVNILLHKASTTHLSGILSYQELPLVSSDFMGNPHSCIIDGLLTQHVDGMIKIFAWYDNEYGYSSRLKDFLCA